jgi:hypothetical protein
MKDEGGEEERRRRGEKEKRDVGIHLFAFISPLLLLSSSPPELFYRP